MGKNNQRPTLFRPTLAKRSASVEPIVPESDVRKNDDPRDRCCHGGERFVHALKAMVTRMMFLAHAILTVWRVTTRLPDSLWWVLSVSFIALIIEALYVLLYKHGKEWKWVSVCVLIYLLCVLPPIWILMLDSTTLLIPGTHTQLNQTATGVLTSVQDGENGVITIRLSENEWAYMMQQITLVCIIIGRWLMPKGELTRNQLSALLLNYVGTASDIVDLFGVLEVQAKLTDTYVLVVLSVWSWSMFQFIFTSTMTKDIEDEDEDEEGGDLEKAYGQHKPAAKRQTKWSKFMKIVHTVLATEAWAVCIALMMQDGPYLIVRLVGLFKYKIATYTMFFFIAKNVLLICLQIYRIVVLIKEHKEEQREEPLAKKKLNDIYKRLTFQDKSDLAKIAPEIVNNM